MTVNKKVSSSMPAGVSRRSVSKGVVWGAPVIATSVAAPLASASPIDENNYWILTPNPDTYTVDDGETVTVTWGVTSQGNPDPVAVTFTSSNTDQLVLATGQDTTATVSAVGQTIPVEYVGYGLSTGSESYQAIAAFADTTNQTTPATVTVNKALTFIWGSNDVDWANNNYYTVSSHVDLDFYLLLDLDVSTGYIHVTMSNYNSFSNWRDKHGNSTSVTDDTISFSIDDSDFLASGSGTNARKFKTGVLFSPKDASYYANVSAFYSSDEAGTNDVVYITTSGNVTDDQTWVGGFEQPRLGWRHQ
ncbi:MAG: hypothetical protein QM613_00100 [Micrococcaceae bacterium]